MSLKTWFSPTMPDEGVSLCPDTRMHRPAWVNDRLLISNHQVTRLRRLTHDVPHDSVLTHVEVEVDLHTSVMGMAGHGVPEVSWLELCEAHEQLAGGENIWDQVLVNRSAVAAFG